ncbi:hypothetical protein LUW76_38270 [Actinomadura madurae]|uniref:hypothetical protein n=1 Tax=Actinomadura madurae TaxID=1993 RepID=UPI002026471C|nr:hypothetical protein [Actinomadura madurae]URM99701.1 hypothetical protein LUW76_38270 [Actinomadura madurae]URN10364.1 hypothetical protein LUW74_48220 [Actinomadura madurae]
MSETDVAVGKFQSDTFRRYYAEGFAEGFAEGTARAVLIVLNTRGLPVSDEVRERVGACRDIQRLDHWLVRAVTAGSIDDVFG